MKRIKKTALDLLDDIYSLAFWMTGNEEISNDLVHCTYLSASAITGERELLKRFRACYVNRFGQGADFCTTEKACKSHLQLIGSSVESAADIKLSVLLSEISGLKHSQISDIVGKPVETVRLWLLWGRKLFTLSNPLTVGQLKAS